MALTTTVPPPAFLYAPDFFKTNKIFTDNEQKLIRQHLDSAQANLFHVHEQLMQDPIDKERIQDLSHQKTELVDLIERCRVALAPIKNVPDDVMQEIFIRYCEDQYLSRKRNGMFLIALCSVCSGWRSIALETPILWSQVLLYDSRQFSFFYMEEAVKLWFSRAGTCPISLNVDIGYGRSSRELRNLAERVITLPSHYRRLSLKLSLKDIEVLLGKLSPDQLWDVEELQAIDADGYDIRRDLNLPFPHSITFPNLKRLTVSPFWNLDSLMSFSPFPQLQKLSVQMTMSVALELLQQSPLLEECDITIKPSDSTVRSNRACYVTLPQLRRLSIVVDNMEDCCIFIDQLVLSNLRYFKVFELVESEFHPDELSEHLAALSQRSGTPNLYHLHLTGKPAPNRNLGILLRNLPHLEALMMRGCAILDEETLEGLVTGTLVPRLNGLLVDRIQPNLNAVTKMAEKRAQNVGLPKLRVSTRYSVIFQL